MTISSFDKRLLIEQIRYIEAKQSLACDTEELLAGNAVHNVFEDRLWSRARCLVERFDLSSALGRAARFSRYANNAAVIVAALLGGLGVFYAVIDRNTINVYWLLLVLLGFNLVSMLLWLTGVSLNMKGLTTGILAKMTGWLPGYIDSSSRSADQAGVQADRAWLACNFTGTVGKWQFSKITHQLWLAYLSAGLALLVLLLMVRQYDFVWGTTLLSESVFVRTTSALSAPLEVLGIAAPTADQVLDTRIGPEQSLSYEHRSAWARFLLGAVLLYGIMPRILLLIWSALMRDYASRNLSIDYYLPYYIRLRQQMLPLSSHGEIVDADASPPEYHETRLATPIQHKLPAETKWVAVELGDEVKWPPPSVQASNDLGHVVDRDSLDLAHQGLQDQASTTVAVAVSSSRSPDRGVQRTIASLLSNSAQRWLVLLQGQNEELASTSRLGAWYRLAEACDVPADHVISMRLA